MNGGKGTLCIRTLNHRAWYAMANLISCRKRIAEDGNGSTNADELHRQVRSAYKSAFLIDNASYSALERHD